ncbi:MAG: hypothetical protein R2769_03200 [Saprospiraceae bacterium]
MKKNTSLKEELHDLSPLLSKLKEGEQPEPKIPGNYFHNMQFEVLNKLKEDLEPNPVSATPKDSIPWYQRIFQPKFALAYAAVIAVCLGIFWWSGQENLPAETIAMEDVSQEEILNYIEENISSFEAEELASIGNNGEVDLLQDVELDDKTVDEYLDKIIDDLDEESLENIF